MCNFAVWLRCVNVGSDAISAVTADDADESVEYSWSSIENVFSNLLVNFAHNRGVASTTSNDNNDNDDEVGLSRDSLTPETNATSSDKVNDTSTPIRLEESALTGSTLGIPAPVTPVPNSSTNSTSSVISGVGSPPQSTPSSFPNSSTSPRSESVPTTPRSTFCRAPGLGPVTLPEGHSGAQHPLVCQICGFSCNSKFHYNSHMNTHGDHQCTMCDYTSRTEGRLKKHMRDSHTVEQQIAAGLDVDTTPRSTTPTSVTKPTTPVGLNLATSMASLLESANLAAAAQAAQNADSRSPDTSPSSVLNGSPDSAEKSSTGLPVDETSPSNSLLPLEQMRALADNPSLISDLASSNLATALMSHGLLGGKQSLLDSVSSFQREEPSTSGVNGERRSSSGKPKIYKCKQCNQVSTSKEDQWVHARSHIPAEKRLECNRCGFVTEYKHHLEYHLRNHIGSKPFQCKKCAYSCVNKSMLNSHMKSHTNVYQFRCRDCSYATKYCHSLKLHLKKYNHNRAGDVNDGADLDVSNGSFEGLGENNPMRRLSESYSIGGDEESSPSPQGSMQQSLAGAMGLTSMVTPNSLNLSQLLLQQQQQADQIDAVNALNAVNAAIRMNALQSVNAGAVLPPRCQFCPYQPINVDDGVRHQMMHILTGHDLSNSIAVPTAIHPNKSLLNGNGEEDKSVENNSFEEREGSEEVEPPPTTTAEDDENVLSDDTGKSEEPQGSMESEKSSSDERSSPADETSDKGARKRKAGLKLNQIAARLQEKKSPEAEDSGTSFEPTECKRERSNESASSENVPSTLASALQLSTPVASLPTTRFLPTLGQQSGNNNLSLFQHVANLQSQQLEEKLRSILELWKFSCGHCKMAFQDQALYQIHMGYHGYENPFKCNRCGHSCNDILDFNLHLFEAKH